MSAIASPMMHEHIAQGMGGSTAISVAAARPGRPDSLDVVIERLVKDNAVAPRTRPSDGCYR